MIENEAPVIADSLWSATANPAPDFPPLLDSAETEVAVIGGGFTGLSAALHLAEVGKKVTILEAETPGWGASGRNGGQVNPGLKEDPDAVEARFGPEIGARMVALSGTAGRLVFDLIAKHEIACDAVQSGWIRAAHSKAALETLRASAAQWQRRGAPLRMLEADEVAAMIGTNAYCGGLIDPRGGNLHPLNYALGLAQAAIRAGARVHGHSRAVRLDKDSGSYRIRTAEATLRADRVLICTNGYTDGLAPPLARTVVPVRSIQVATKPLSDNVAASILPDRQAPSDTRRLLLYFRKDAQGRFIMGGRGTYGDGGTRKQFDALRKVSRQVFPQIEDAAWEHAWGGFIAVTADHYPHLSQLDEGIVACLGYNGRGVAMATAMGQVLADWATGIPPADLDFPMTPVRPIPLHGFRKLAVRAGVAGYRMLDRMGI